MVAQVEQEAEDGGAGGAGRAGGQRMVVEMVAQVEQEGRGWWCR